MSTNLRIKILSNKILLLVKIVVKNQYYLVIEVLNLKKVQIWKHRKKFNLLIFLKYKNNINNLLK